MNECKFCKKEVEQTEGKKKKEFCNNTCRSNFWYGENKKGKKQVTKKAPKKPTSDKPAEIEDKLYQFHEILNFAKGGKKKEEIEKLITRNGKLTFNQKGLIYSKIKN